MLVATIAPLPCDGITLVEMTVNTLTHQCREETKHFAQRQPYDDRFCRELLRRALVLNDAQAWRVVYEQYQRQVYKWVQARLVFTVPESEVQTLVDDAFIKMQGTFTRHPQKFADYLTLAALLGLLRLCAERVVQDYVGKAQQELPTIPLDELLAAQEAYAVDERHALVGGGQAPSALTTHTLTAFFTTTAEHDLWSLLQHLLADEKEQVVLFALFIEGQKPRQLYAERADLFQSVDEINTVRERLKARLQRNQEFRAYLQQVSEIGA